MRQGRWGVVLGSVAFHALLVLLFVLDLAGKPVATPTPPMTVFLERAPVPPKAAPASRGGARTRSAPTKTAAPTPVAVPAAAAPPSSSEGSAAIAGPPAPPSLLGMGNCRLATLDHLSAEARARCQEHVAQAMGEGRAPRPNFDPTGRYARDARPYLTRPPHNGCKPVAAVKNEVTGQTSATIGIGCAWSF